METRKGSLSDIAGSVMSNKSEAELEKIKEESISRRSGTIEDSIATMYDKKEEQKTDS